ncbi:OmpA family protein [Casimicrobium huifangae]|jgi:outer membrane protein OmpA-like peptidoglycan-associated protein|uniref:OmpA family protein n=1 Tax=Casimicrobium huifangae TaxID=2591109 RepID=UPI0012EB99DD|nr:OmpA family protein [Casimicrobium huifangae]
MTASTVVARLFAAATVAVAALAHADLGFPDYVKLPPQITVNPDQRLIKEELADAEFESTKAGAPKVTKRGVHYFRWYFYKPAAGEQKPGFYNGTEERIYKAVSGALAPAGWQNVYLAESKDTAVWRTARDGKDLWLRMSADGPQAQVSFELIEVGGSANTLVHNPPATKPEVFTDRDPIPYLTAWPGSTLKAAGRSPDSLDVTIAFKAGNEAPVAGQSTVYRHYQGPSNLSALQFTRDNREALVKAGWTVLYPAETDSAGGTIVARYLKNGRDIWARLDYEYGASLSYSVADTASDDWAAKLNKDCRLPLYGVTFDFNKATIKPESEVVLARAAAVLKQATGFAVEVQGHTDNVGGDDYNQKLSEARAASVKQWLGSHGADAARLSSKGYGKTQPVADNGSDFGRAKNRRVELVKAGCRN